MWASVLSFLRCIWRGLPFLGRGHRGHWRPFISKTMSKTRIRIHYRIWCQAFAYSPFQDRKISVKWHGPDLFQYRFCGANWFKSEPKNRPKWCKSGSKIAEMVHIVAGNQWKLARACGIPVVGVRAVDCWQTTLWPLFSSVFSFFFFPVFSPPFFPPSLPFLIGVLGSKNLFSESCLECPKT